MTAVPDSTPLLSADGSGRMFDRIARRYDLLNRIMSLGMDRLWRRRLIAALAVPPGGRVLDVATGTGDVALAIARRTAASEVIGLDPSAGMLDVARRKTPLGWPIRYVEGDARALPFDDGHFDAVSIAFGIRNVPDRDLGLREMLRVLRPGGRLGILELGEPHRGPLALFARLWVHRVVPVLGRWLSSPEEYDYLQRSIAAFPPAEAFAEQIRAAGASSVRVCPMAFGGCNLYVAER